MELYDAIFYRKSIRKYSNKKITSELMEEIKNISSNITYLNRNLNIKAHVVERGHLIHFLMGKKNKLKAPTRFCRCFFISHKDYKFLCILFFLRIHMFYTHRPIHFLYNKLLLNAI